MIRQLGFVCGILFFWTSSVSAAEAPFVSGFDRFVSHEEITSETGGRLLLTELSCTACHQTVRVELQPKGGPDLNGIGTRASRDWLRKYLSDPHQVKPGSTMPDLLSGLDAEEKQHTVSSLAAFLSTLTESYPEVKGSGTKPVPFQFWLKGNSETGERLYHTIGCVACHEPDSAYETAARKPTPLDQMLEQLDPEEIKELGFARLARPVKSVPHGDLAGKYTPETLTFFLLDPSRSRPAGRMPDFHLTPVEAADLAAYLISKHPVTESSAAQFAISKADIDTGRKLFVDLGCANCHAVKGVAPKLVARDLGTLNFKSTENCVRGESGKLPQFDLSESQKSALQSAAVGLAQEGALSQQGSLEFTLLKLNCYACHEREERGGVGRNRKAYFETVQHIDLGDEGRIPPELTGVGRKLTSSWFKKVLDGTGTVRPFLTARMPKFPAKFTGSLPTDFARADGFERKSAEQVFGNTRELADAGRQLFDTGCVKCHPIHGDALPGVIGVDLHDATDRIHPDWIRTFLLDPGAVKPRTRMPTFFPNGVSSNKEILDGDVDRQIASLWEYLKESDQLPLPQQVLDFRDQNFELVPQDKPLLLRTFMRDAGTHAIAVGFPQKIHFAYDAEQVRLAEIWKGRFLDAQGTWFERSAPPADPLGEEIHKLPSGASLFLTDAEGKPLPDVHSEFRGYRLGKDGIPVFLSRLGPLEIEERIAVTDRKTLLRSWVISVRKGADVQQRVLRCQLLSDTAKPTGAKSFSDREGLTVHFLEGFTGFGISGAETSIIQPEQPKQDQSVTLKIEYQW